VIAIGELRDLETISLALTAAETGHLVLAHAAHQQRDPHHQRIIASSRRQQARSAPCCRSRCGR
jgi:twitching motility protein PilT